MNKEKHEDLYLKKTKKQISIFKGILYYRRNFAHTLCRASEGRQSKTSDADRPCLDVAINQESILRVGIELETPGRAFG